MGSGEIQGERNRGFDLLKGIGILAVVALHSTGRSASKFSHPGDGLWWTLNVVNLLVNFGVPLFLLVSAVVWTQSYLRRADWRNFYKRRARGVLIPYVVWSAIYLVLRHYRAHNWDVGSNEVIVDLLWGKASFHLYFMSILIQFGILLPLFVWGIRKFNWGFGLIAAAAVLKQAIVFEIQHVWLKFAFPATLAVWYLMVFVPGSWIGAYPGKWPEVWGRIKLPCCLLAVAATGGWMWISIRRLEQLPIGSMAYNWLNAAFYASVGLCLVGFSTEWAKRESKATTWLVGLGTMSLQIYLMHPLVMDVLSLSRLAHFFARMGAFAPIASFALTLGITIGIAIGLAKIKLDPILFGKG